MQRHPGAGDRRRAGAAIGLEHVAIHRDLLLADGRQVRDGAGASGPIRRWISCVRPEGLPELTSRRVRSWVARGSIEYFGRDPALAGAAQPRGAALFQGGGAQQLGVAEADEAGPLGVARDGALKGHGPQRVGGAMGRPHARPFRFEVCGRGS